MGGSSSSKKFIEIGVKFIGEEERESKRVGIFTFRFLKSKVIDRIIVQMRIEMKVGSFTWIILRSIEDFQLLEKSLELPGELSVSFPKSDQQIFRKDSEVIALQRDMSKWLYAAAKIGIKQKPMLSFLGVTDDEVRGTAATTIDLGMLIDNCDTGDILLFKTQGIVSSSIRKITSSKFDHVGVVVVKVLDGGGREVCLLEASGDDHGVNIHNLRGRLWQWYLANASIRYRRLRCERDDSFRNLARSFIQQVQGLKYGWGVKSWMLNKQEKHPQEKTHFFCSELVTAFYKHLGFIDSSSKSRTYMPGDFADKKSGSRLNLFNAILEQEMDVTRWPKRELRALPTVQKRERSHSDDVCGTDVCLRTPKPKTRPDSSVRVINNGNSLTKKIYDDYLTASDDVRRKFFQSSPFI